MRYVDAQTCRFLNFPQYREWCRTRTHDEDFKRSIVMLADNRKILPTVLGPRQQTFMGEFRYDVWRVEFKGAFVWILTGKSGTAFELEHGSDPDAIPEFSEWLYAELLKTGAWDGKFDFLKTEGAV